MVLEVTSGCTDKGEKTSSYWESKEGDEETDRMLNGLGMRLITEDDMLNGLTRPTFRDDAC